jgi:hypothetical protein
MRYPEEPHVLVGRTLIHSGAVSLLQDLLASGHDVALVDGELRVEPLEDLHENTLYVIDALDEDLMLLLTAGGPTVH